MRESCENCHWYRGSEGLRTGDCHRHAPRPVEVLLLPEDPDLEPFGAVWPRVHGTDFCGEFTQGET